MKSRYLMIPLFAVLVACGGGGGGTSTPSPFAGNWQGPYTIPSPSQNGTVNMTISSSGAVNGTGTNITAGFNFSVSGSIDNAGNINATISGGTTGTLSGTLTISSTTGHLIGAVTQTIPGSGSFNSNFDLTKS